MSESASILVRQMRSGDAEALARFIDRNRGRLLAIVERKMGPGIRRHIEPDDIVQEVSAEALRTFSKALTADGEPFAWLCQIAERRIIDAHRRLIAKKRDVRRERGLETGGDATGRQGLIAQLALTMTTPTRALSRKGNAARLVIALESLPTEQQEALRLRYVEGRPSKEIADALGKSDGAVRVMLSRALARLQQLLADPETGRRKPPV